MGHLVRQIAISKEFPQSTILTLSGAAPVALNAGIHLEYCPSYSKMDKRTWHRGYLRDRIVAIAKEVNADVLVFDGVVPYVGLLNAMQSLDLPAVWMRRGLWRESARRWPLRYAPMFDLIIEPDDIGRSRDSGVTQRRGDAKRVGVITEAGTTLHREQAAHALGVDPRKPTLLFNIGSNRGLQMQRVEEFLAQVDGWNIISTSDALGRERSQFSLHKVSGIFPLYPYLSAVDLAVTSVGYNAAHEFTASGVATIVMPADNATDDQYARADAMVDLGISLRADTEEELTQALTTLMSDSSAREQAKHAALAEASRWRRGAAESAELIRTVTRSTHRTQPRLLARKAIEWMLGLRPGPSTHPVFTSEITTELLRANQSVEHLLAGASPEYRARREAIARKWLEK